MPKHRSKHIFDFSAQKPQLFFGYELVKYRKEKGFKIAYMEKAILDYFYINSFIREEADFASLRINNDVFFEKFNEKRLNNFLETFGQKRLSNRIKSFLEFIKNA